MRPLLFLTLAACAPDPCPNELMEAQKACARAEVVGTHDNHELYEAIDAYKQCFAEPVRVICSNVGLSGNNLTIEK